MCPSYNNKKLGHLYHLMITQTLGAAGLGLGLGMLLKLGSGLGFGQFHVAAGRLWRRHCLDCPHTTRGHLWQYSSSAMSTGSPLSPNIPVHQDHPSGY